MTHILRATGIVKEYALGRIRLRVLDGVDVSIDRGQFAAIVGASGSGKSTLLHILGALDIPQRGQVWFEGQPMFELEPLRRLPDLRNGTATRGAREGGAGAFGEVIRGGRTPTVVAPMEQQRNGLRNTAFGFVFQFYHLMPEFDVLENVMMPAVVGRPAPRWSADRTALRDRAVELLETVELAHRLHHRPNELSGGERQRVAIARALMNRPEVLLADEPTGNLDTKTGGEILERLRAFNAAGQTIIMVTHDAEIARRADRTIRLVDGRAV
ncbi:MAG: ABC transporter ATP-binding protein [Phycisphaerae bacterium]|nr:ABC transporter ATP-binding protein [Phycisphaerae bacterium]